jgi:hypothetical protein
VNALRAKLIFLVLLACQLSLMFGATLKAMPVSWWEGP